jgi:hypothetical protein
LLEFPGFGTLPDRPSNTLVRVGLPFSPLFRYHRENSFSAESPAIPATGDRITVKSGETKFIGEMTSVKFSSGSSASWRIEFLSWSAAAAALGILLLVCSFLVRRGRPVPSPQVEVGGSGIGPSAEPDAAADGGAR